MSVPLLSARRRHRPRDVRTKPRAADQSQLARMIAHNKTSTLLWVSAPLRLPVVDS